MQKKPVFMDDPRVKELIEAKTHPKIEEIGPIAKDYGVDCVYKLWDFFDFIKMKWHEHKDHHPDW